jgi:hypothetical protein
MTTAGYCRNSQAPRAISTNARQWFRELVFK